MAGIEPATATLAGRARYLSCHPTGRLRHHVLWPAVFSWCSRYGRVNYPACTRGFSGRSIRLEENENRPAGLFPGAAAASACSRLPGNHSAGQGSRKPRRRIHVPGSLRCLAYRHVSMVSRHRERGNCIFCASCGHRGDPGVAGGAGLKRQSGRLRRARAQGGGGSRGRPQGAGAAGCGAMATRGGRAETEFGINGGSSGKDGVITLGDHALVFSKLRRVTCGVAVHKAVDNRRDVRITRGILWRTCGQEKNLK